MIELHAAGIRCAFDRRTGLLDGFTVTDAGINITPLHRAPWVGTAEVMPPDAAPHMERLGGDFFCAPFAASEGNSPLHGWPANSIWSVADENGAQLHAVLDRKVFGATVTKELSLRDAHPFVYQRHRFTGGSGHVSVANHANISLLSGGLIRTSPKRSWETTKEPQESDPDKGRSNLVYPAQTDDPTKFPGLDGRVNLTEFPWNPRHEDFVIGIEAPGHTLGWTAVTRPVQGDVYLSLRNPRELPMTMLWHSNGGRDYPPWSGRHVGCLGVEEGAAAHMLGVSSEADLVGPGALPLDPTTPSSVRHVIGAIAWPSGEPVVDIAVNDTSLVVIGANGAKRNVPFDQDFLGLP